MNDICRNDTNTEFWGTDRCSIIIIFLGVCGVPLLMRFKQCKNMGPYWWDWCWVFYIIFIIIVVCLYKGWDLQTFLLEKPFLGRIGFEFLRRY